MLTVMYTVSIISRFCTPLVGSLLIVSSGMNEHIVFDALCWNRACLRSQGGIFTTLTKLHKLFISEHIVDFENGWRCLRSSTQVIPGCCTELKTDLLSIRPGKRKKKRATSVKTAPHIDRSITHAYIHIQPALKNGKKNNVWSSLSRDFARTRQLCTKLCNRNPIYVQPRRLCIDACQAHIIADRHRFLRHRHTLRRRCSNRCRHPCLLRFLSPFPRRFPLTRRYPLMRARRRW